MKTASAWALLRETARPSPGRQSKRASHCLQSFWRSLWVLLRLQKQKQRVVPAHQVLSNRRLSKCKTWSKPVARRTECARQILLTTNSVLGQLPTHPSNTQVARLKAKFAPTQLGATNRFVLVQAPTFGQILVVPLPSKVLYRLNPEPSTPNKKATTQCAAKAEQHFAQRWLAWDLELVTKSCVVKN